MADDLKIEGRMSWRVVSPDNHELFILDPQGVEAWKRLQYTSDTSGTSQVRMKTDANGNPVLQTLWPNNLLLVRSPNTGTQQNIIALKGESKQWYFGYGYLVGSLLSPLLNSTTPVIPTGAENNLCYITVTKTDITTPPGATSAINYWNIKGAVLYLELVDVGDGTPLDWTGVIVTEVEDTGTGTLRLHWDRNQRLRHWYPGGSTPVPGGGALDRNMTGQYFIMNWFCAQTDSVFLRGNFTNVFINSAAATNVSGMTATVDETITPDFGLIP